MPEVEAVRANEYLAPETLVQLAPFELRAKMIVEGVMSGMHRSPYQGMAVEFAEHRQYVPGDDLKHLDWKVYGRSDKLYIKQYQQETTLDVILLVDASASMSYGSLKVKPGWGGTTASRQPVPAGPGRSGRLRRRAQDHPEPQRRARAVAADRQRAQHGAGGDDDEPRQGDRSGPGQDQQPGALYLDLRPL
jgi:uncharacterized protein (DUF58 family)